MIARSRRPASAIASSTGAGHRLVVARRPHQRRRQPAVGGGHHLGVGRALGAQPAEVGGVQLVPATPGDHRRTRSGVGAGLYRDPAPDPAIGQAVRVSESFR